MGDIAIDLIEEKQKSETEHLFYFRTVANMKVQVVKLTLVMYYHVCLRAVIIAPFSTRLSCHQGVF